MVSKPRIFTNLENKSKITVQSLVKNPSFSKQQVQSWRKQWNKCMGYFSSWNNSNNIQIRTKKQRAITERKLSVQSLSKRKYCLCRIKMRGKPNSWAKLSKKRASLDLNTRTKTKSKWVGMLWIRIWVRAILIQYYNKMS